LNDVVGFETITRKVGAARIAGAKLGYLNDRQRPPVFGWVLLQRQAIEKARDLVEALDLPPLRNLAY
jgi:hypothetical protein